jgi:glycosyltransferase involved in cell wall biosynthesis
MMLIAMAVYDTEDNGRTELTERTLISLQETVNLVKHRLIVVDNGSCQETQDLYERYTQQFPFTVIRLGENKGTAVAINTAWKQRRKNEHAVKMDNDVVIHEPDWPDMMELVFDKDPRIGICGLKRKDVWESPESPHPHGVWYQSKLRMLPHEPGERWLVVEEVNHVIGTCQAYSSVLLSRIGYLYQMQDHGSKYGFDDSLASYRAQVIGFKRVFLPGVHIDHIDPGGTEFTDWKHQNSGEYMQLYHRVRDEYLSKRRSVYYGGP